MQLNATKSSIIPITIQYIAKQAGVSPSTASHVCNDHAPISKGTNDRVCAQIGPSTTKSVSVRS